MGLLGEFLVYFADNVLVNIVACAACYLGTDLIPILAKQPLHNEVLGLIINWVLTLLLWAVSRRMIKKYSGESSDEESGEDNSDKKAAWNHILAMAPWIARVGAINLFAQFGVVVNAYTANDEYYGRRFVYYCCIFVVMFSLVWLMSRAWAKQEDAGADLLSLPVFVLDTVNGSLLSTSGKAVHFVCSVIAVAVAGPSVNATLISYVIMEVIMGSITVFILGYCLPRFSLKTTQDKVSHTVLAYLATYSWAFTFVDFLWWYFYTYLGSFALYWAAMAGLLVVALVLAAVCGNFYGGPGAISKTFANMLVWTIGFGAWWGWCQVMADVDTWATDNYGAQSLFFVNLAILVGLFTVTALVYVSSNHEDMLSHDFERANPIPSEAVAFGRDVLLGAVNKVGARALFLPEQHEGEQEMQELAES
eukprot:TRINITY_DN1012_c0_g1_i2.p1 TRINITY_DN1012_c0_g1~~TRINITY_DN1012_c0_g1_i2.p1  ORF type:complete len:452 (-),score=67.87 TRINITY_DN1012_c0_g1_i2:181-1440(-)